MVKKFFAGVLVLVLGWSLKFGWNLVTYEELSDEEYEAQWIQEDDAWVGEEIADGSAADAEGWYDQRGHATFEADPATMRKTISRFRTAGAQGVWVVGIEEFGGAKISDTLAVGLPPAGAARDRLFALETELWGGGDPTPDLGQRYLVMSFD